MGFKIKKYVHRKFSNRLLQKIESDRNFELRGIQFELSPGIFHPKYFNSSLIILDWVENNNIEGKKVLELGCGSGASALLAAKKGAESYAADISTLAIDNLQKNQELNKLKVQTFHSDLFKDIPQISFDYILINPPFYPKNPTSETDFAWYCGEGFSYFKNLFPELKRRWDQMECLISLSEDCNLEMIQKIAAESGFMLKEIAIKKSFWEKNYLYMVNQV